jgi:hypothetical protein
MECLEGCQPSTEGVVKHPSDKMGNLIVFRE